jgi:hypothetical protein
MEKKMESKKEAKKHFFIAHSPEKETRTKSPSLGSLRMVKSYSNVDGTVGTTAPSNHQSRRNVKV